MIAMLVYLFYGRLCGFWIVILKALFFQELKFVFPNAQQMNRSGQVSDVPIPFELLQNENVIILFLNIVV